VDETQRERYNDDLRGLIRGELHFDEVSRSIYSTDASIFQVRPFAIVAPKDEGDLQTLVRYAAENHFPLIPRGAGTGVAGESLGTGIVVDLSRHFRSILETGADWVRVQPGVVYRTLNDHLAKMGRRFAPDPSSGVQCTVGGMLATDASGARALRHGYTRDHVAGLSVVLDNGDLASVTSDTLDRPSAELPSRLDQITLQVQQLLFSNTQTIEACRPRTRFDRCGYLLHDVLRAGTLDLPRLLVGSEGTLALFAEGTLRTIPLAGGRSVVLLGFDSLDGALQAALDALPSKPSACELIDRRLASLAKTDAWVRDLIPAGVEAVLLVEYEADSAEEARESARLLESETRKIGQGAVPIRTALNADEAERLWGLRETVLPSLYRLRGGNQPIPFVEDVGVPPESLPVYVHRVQEILREHETTASFFIHVGTGQVHARPFLDLGRPEDRSRLWSIAESIHGAALELGGTVSAQHGTGLARTPWVARQYGPLYAIMRELKEIFDPEHILNPGKIIGPDPGMPAWPLRTTFQLPAEPSAWLLRWRPGELADEVANCNGCGHCRSEFAGERMCPIFRATHAEAASPRAKANLLRSLFQEGADPRLFSSDDVREVADLCVNCRMCASECPAQVNIPKLMLEAKAANVAEHGLDRTDWTMARTEGFAAVASLFSALVNRGLTSKSARWFLERLFGVSRQRHLPRFANRSFIRQAARRGWTRRPRGRRPRVAYFVDIYANYNDPEIAEAVVAVLHHNQVEVYVPKGQRGCGMAPLAYGDIETARETAEHNIRILAEAAREGMPIVCAEPTAALMLRQDYPNLVDDPDAILVADQVVEFTSFLREMHVRGLLRTDFQNLPLSIGHHVPCHIKALGQPPAGPLLLRLIPGARVHTIDVNCSGMAGTFGLKARNYELSLEAGRPMLDELRRPDSLAGSTECSTCRMQMEEGSGKRTLHPAQYLALAYGLMPQIANRLKQPANERVLQ
jgi:FAD/FMN-containing dehydrogenase/Fe-S oxidoreductase